MNLKQASMQDRRNIDVAVFVTGNEEYGVQRSLVADYTLSSEYGIKFHYLCLSKGSLFDKLSEAGADVRIIGGSIPVASHRNIIKLAGVYLANFKNFVNVFCNIRSYLKETSPDLLYTHLVTEHIIAGFAARSCGVKSVGHFRRMLNTKRNFGLSYKILSLLMSCSLNKGIAVSNATRNALWGPLKRKTTVIYNGRDLDAICEAGQEISDENLPAADVIYVGRLTRIKKQDILIDAIHVLADKGVSVKTLLVGGPADESNAYYIKLKEKISRYDLDNDIYFAGYLEKPFGALCRAKVSVLCCTIEGCPNIVAESIACKTPIVVADSGGGGELVIDGVTGLKFKSDDPVHLAECLQTLLTDQGKRHELSESGLEDAKRRFSISTHMTNLRSIFEQVIDN